MRWSRRLLAGPKMPGPYVQDGPPAGGYKPINTRRSISPGGLSSAALMGGVACMTLFGMYKVISANSANRYAPSGGRGAHAAGARRAARIGGGAGAAHATPTTLQKPRSSTRSP